MKKAKKTIAGMESLFEIRQYDMKNSCFKLQGGRCMDLVRVICTDFQSIREVDLEYENLKMEQFYSRYPSDIKLVCVNMPERCTEQLAFVSHKLENCQHEWKRKLLVSIYRFPRATFRCKRWSDCPPRGCPSGDVNHQTGKNRSINKDDESRTDFF